MKTRTLLPIFALAMSACTGSIFDGADPADPLPNQQLPVAPPSVPAEEAAATPKNMTFALNPDAELSDGPFDILFLGQAFDPFSDVQRALGTETTPGTPLNASLKLWKVQDFPEYNEVHAGAIFHLDFDLATTGSLRRDFKPETVLIVKRVGEDVDGQDTLKGTLVDMEGDGTVLKIDLRRKASNTEAEANTNAWNGKLSVTRDGKDLSLGVLRGVSR